MKLLLVCAAGMSTSLLVRKMAKYAKKQGIPLEIEARPANEVDHDEGWDVVLLGPQIGYQYDVIRQKLGPDKPLDIIPMVEYGRQNCAAIFNRLTTMLA